MQDNQERTADGDDCGRSGYAVLEGVESGAGSMDYFVSAAELESIINDLKSPIRRTTPHIAEECLLKVAENGYANYSDIEDIMYHSDDRINKLTGVMSLKRWCDIFSVSRRTYYSRPRKQQQSAWGSEGISATDLALLLINFERIGYSVEALPLIIALKGDLNRHPFITDSELQVLWYESTRHKGAPVVLRVDRNEAGEGWKEEKFKTTTGYKAEVIWNDEEKPIRLTVKGPKYRRKPDPIRTVCHVCGCEWYRGDPESSASHRKEHAWRLKYLDPKPNPRLSGRVQGRHHLCLVTTKSPQWMHNEMHLRALAFQREFKYDFIQWESPKRDTDPYVRGYMFANPSSVVVGACALRWREHEEHFFWGLQWIWISPGYRRKGILTRHWPALRKSYGDFFVEGPVSDEMMSFLDKYKDTGLTKVDIGREGASRDAIPKDTL